MFVNAEKLNKIWKMKSIFLRRQINVDADESVQNVL